MRNIWLVSLVVFISAAWLAAETAGRPSATPATSSAAVSPQNSQGAEAPGSKQNPSSANSNASSPRAPNKTSVEGCLSGSAGSYTLTANNGTTYQLQGKDADLSKHVGQEVKISGMPSSSGGTATAAGSSGAQALEVTKVKKVSKTCTTGNTSNPSSR